MNLIELSSGGHGSREDGLCLMEAVAYAASEAHTDMPKCVSPVLSKYGQRLNDTAPSDAHRQELTQYIWKLIGTAGDEALDQQRALVAVDWAVRRFAPIALRSAGLVAEAERLESLPVANRGNLELLRSEANRAAASAASVDYAASAASAAYAAYAASAAYAAYAKRVEVWNLSRRCFEEMIDPPPARA